MDESNIPIDINIGKLQDWLISRRHVSKEWQKNILPIREKINNAIQDMPVHNDIAALLSGSYINYFHCLKIIEILKETEADTRNLFGRYGSQRMKDWLDVVKNYERDNLFLAEAAQMLARNISYEIPAMKKQIAKEEQMHLDCDKKRKDYLKSKASAKTEFLNSCKQLGIKGNKIKQELEERIHELPAIYDKVSSSLKPLHLSIELYLAFTKYVLDDKTEINVLPLLHHIIENGNTTVYEWMYAEPPLTIEPNPIHVSIRDAIQFDDENQGAGDQIDFDDDADDFGGLIDPADIDFEDGDAGGEIDWGNLDAAIENVPHEVANIRLEGSDIVIEDNGLGSGIARGKEALTLLDNPDTRSRIIDQLVELESFLKMRVYETNISNESQSFSLVQQLPTESVDALAAMLAEVQDATRSLLAPEIAHLHNVKHSNKYVDMLTAQLQQKLAICEKMRNLAAREGKRAVAASERAAELRPLLARLVDRTVELQAHIEKEISKKYKGRPVNIIGGVKFL